MRRMRTAGRCWPAVSPPSPVKNAWGRATSQRGQAAVARPGSARCVAAGRAPAAVPSLRRREAQFSGSASRGHPRPSAAAPPAFPGGGCGWAQRGERGVRPAPSFLPRPGLQEPLQTKQLFMHLIKGNRRQNTVTCQAQPGCAGTITSTGSVVTQPRLGPAEPRKPPRRAVSLCWVPVPRHRFWHSPFH